MTPSTEAVSHGTTPSSESHDFPAPVPSAGSSNGTSKGAPAPLRHATTIRANAKINIPRLRCHKASGQGYIVVDGKFLYLGRYDHPATHEKYHRLTAEYVAAGCRLPVKQEDLMINELLLRFWEWAQKYYRRADGQPTGEAENFKPIIAVVRSLYGHSSVVSFGPLALRAVRQKFIERGLCRTNINQWVNRLRRIFRWGVSEELVPATVLHALEAVPGLKYGRSEAHESAPVKPVPEERVHAIRPYVSRQVWAMIELQLLTGARSGEIVILSPDDIDRSGPIWVYRPSQHKTLHHGHERLIYLGPRAQNVLRPFLLRPGNAYCFSPADAEAERRTALHEQRTTPMSCGNKPGSHRKIRPERAAGDHYVPNTYHRAIQRACDMAFPVPEELAAAEAAVIAWEENFRVTTGRYAKLSDYPQELLEIRNRVEAWRAKQRWHPHQLRHNAATFLRREFGLETARVILGHKSAAVTTMYAEADLQKAVLAMGKVG